MALPEHLGNGNLGLGMVESAGNGWPKCLFGRRRPDSISFRIQVFGNMRTQPLGQQYNLDPGWGTAMAAHRPIKILAVKPCEIQSGGNTASALNDALSDC